MLGGTFVTTYFSGIVDEHDLVHPGGYPGTLKDILGIWVEEQDALPEGEQNAFIYEGKEYPADMLCDIMHLEGAECVSSYLKDFYKDTPVITANSCGKGKAWYVGTRSDECFYRAFVKDVMDEAGVHGIMETPEGVEAAVRKNEKGTVIFLLNHNTEEAEVVLQDGGKDLLGGADYEGGSTVTLAPKDVMLLLRKE